MVIIIDRHFLKKLRDLRHDLEVINVNTFYKILLQKILFP